VSKPSEIMVNLRTGMVMRDGHSFPITNAFNDRGEAVETLDDAVVIVYGAENVAWFVADLRLGERRMLQ